MEFDPASQSIWDDLTQTLKDHGVHNYSIYLDSETSQLFGYVEIEDEDRWNAIAATESCGRWWAFMKDIMPSNPDDSPVAEELSEVFHLD